MKYLILIIISIVGTILTIAIAPYVLFLNDKIDEIPQYNCYILETQLEKWKDDTFISKELVKEQIIKECITK